MSRSDDIVLSDLPKLPSVVADLVEAAGDGELWPDGGIHTEHAALVQASVGVLEARIQMAEVFERAAVLFGVTGIELAALHATAPEEMKADPLKLVEWTNEQLGTHVLLDRPAVHAVPPSPMPRRSPIERAQLELHARQKAERRSRERAASRARARNRR